MPNQKARQNLEYLFAEVEHLPRAFNIADRAAEDKGLRETFREMGEAVLQHPMVPKKGSVNKPLIRRLYDEIWVPGARKSYNAAIAQKTLASEVPPTQRDEQGNILNISERSTANWNRDVEVDILRRYSTPLVSAPVALSDGKIANIERIFNP